MAYIFCSARFEYHHHHQQVIFSLPTTDMAAVDKNM
jgi:hypothetical protein